MDTAKKLAKKGFEEAAVATTNSTSRHGLSKGQRREKTLRNRAARRKADRAAVREQD